MSEPNPPEPSMEEILASIRRIISEDVAAQGEEDGAKTASGHAEEPDVLVLDQPLPSEATDWPFDPPVGPQRGGGPPHADEAPSSARPASSEHPPEDPWATRPAQAAASSGEDPIQAEGPVTASGGPAQAPPPEAHPANPPAQAPAPPHGARLAAAAFERLYDVVDNAPEPPPAPGAHRGQTLDEIARDLLQPLIRQWMDEHLEEIVRERIDREVDRIARGRVR